MTATRILFILATLALAFIGSEGFGTLPSFVGRAALVTSTTSLDACRVNAKKEKRKRNRENMRKFMTRGTSRRKMMKKLRSNDALRLEAEFIAKCFTTVPPAADVVDASR
eukprot:CAMPEP_0172419044 /NCGR_PEP_ID=MMETSP1064-20121228/5476_1 /TAXON_ID=202472 /ORGANISM="Aulacoseira subarctica , Strain CCAP 1002/5" /LENGTH=109 /DNA_ID=CAMNT_0013158291 /DNA_START=69 /DNA_END=398 /DNA_ORIENTATION=-